MAVNGGLLRVMVVDDHPLVRSAVRQAITSPGIVVVAEAGTAADALADAPLAKPDVILLDLGLPDQSGLQLLRELGDLLPGTLIIVLTISTAVHDIEEAVRAGAAGYLTKDMEPGALFRAVDGLRRGELAMSRRVAAEAVRELRADWARVAHGCAEALSAREEEVLRLMADGLTDREIGERLGISRRTAESHVAHVLHKLDAKSRAQAVRRYLEG
ncbi:MAG: response regulator transcription factor [Chloroflexota bacterium]